MTRLSRTRRDRPTCRPCLEALEDRSLLSAGALDPTFGTGGLVITDLNSAAHDSAYDVALQADGKALAVGTSGGNFALVRYNLDGTRDATFGADGVVTTDFKGTDTAYAVALTSDGKILVAGGSTTFKGGIYRSKLALARYDLGGKLDTTFGNRGTVTTDLGSGSCDRIYALAIQADGKIVAAGETNSFPGGDNFLVARYTASGRLDSTFGNGGVVSTDFQAALSVDEARDLAIQGDGKIVVAGRTTTVDTGADRFALARYHANGSLDATFGTGGRQITAIGPWSDATDVELLADGRILVGGSSDGNYAVARYLAAGGLDPTFGSGGVSTGPEVPEGYFWGTGMALQANGKILVCARVQMVDGSENFGLVRLNADGSLDATFGTGGGLTTDFHPTMPLNSGGAAAVAVQADGNIVVAGATRRGTGFNSDFALARYLGDEPLLAVGVGTTGSAGQLSANDLAPLVAEATRRWQAAGADASVLRNVTVRVADLGGTTLGMTDGKTIWLDDDAAGWGWFIDATPGDDAEFVTPGDQGELGRIDLLTALMHEMGHVLGYDHEEEGALAATLAVGTRLSPAEPSTAALDQVFSQPTYWGDVVAVLRKTRGAAAGWNEE